MERVRRVPVYTAVVGALLLAVMFYALAQGSPVGYILATVLLVFVGGPALVIWVHARREHDNGGSSSLGAHTSEGQRSDDSTFR